MKVSKKAIWMWFAESLTKSPALAVLFFWFVSGAGFIYFVPQKNLGKILETALMLDKWIFLGFSLILAFLIFSAVSSAFYKYWSLSYKLEEAAIKIVKGAYKKEESYIPYKNIQSVDIRVSAKERFWGLASVLVFTSAVGDKNNPDSAEGYIEGLKYNEAIVLKDELLKRIK